MHNVLMIDIVTAAIAIVCLLPLVIPRPPRTTLATKSGYFADMKQGFHYIWARPGLAMLIGMMALLVFFTAAPASLLPILVQDHLGGDVLKLGWIGTASGIGGIAGGLLLGAWGGFKKRIHTTILGLAIMIPCSVGVGLTSISYFYTTVIAMIFMGVGMAFSSAPLAAIQNAVIARDMQGRVFSLFNSVVILMMPLGLLVGGPVAETFGIRWLYFIASAAWLIILPVALCSKPLMNLENQPAEAVTV